MTLIPSSAARKPVGRGVLHRLLTLVKRPLSDLSMVVLVITPNPVPLSAALDLLAINATVTTAAADATNLARTGQYDFILIDLDTPGANTLVSNLRGYAPLIAISDACNTDAIRALIHGAFEWVTKRDMVRDLPNLMERLKAESNVEGAGSTHSIVARAMESAKQSLDRIERSSGSNSPFASRLTAQRVS